MGLRRLALEGLTIVAGILLAFGIDAWWDRRGAAEAERAMRLLDSLKAGARVSAETSR